MDKRQFRNSIRGKIITRTLLVSVIPLLVLGLFAVVSFLNLGSSVDGRVETSRDRLSQDVVGANLSNDAQAIARENDVFVTERIKDALGWANDPVVISAAKRAGNQVEEEGLSQLSTDQLEQQFAANKSLNTDIQARNYIVGVVERSGDFEEVFFTESHGLNVAGSATTSDFVQNDEQWWQLAWENGTYVGAIEFDGSTESFAMDIAVRIVDPATGRGIGVMKAVLGIGLAQEVADRYAASNEAEVTIVTGGGLLVAETASGHEPERMLNPSIDLTAEGKPAGSLELAEGGSGFSLGEEVVFGYATTSLSELVADLDQDTNNLDWVVIVERSPAEAFAPLDGIEALQDDLNSSTKTFAFLVLGALVAVSAIALGVAVLLANAIVRPIRRLRDQANEVAEERLPVVVRSIREQEDGQDPLTVELIEIDSGDEVEELAQAFNSVQATAVRLASEQADLRRRNVAQTFVNLGRRNQNLLGRQLEFIDSLERKETDPDVLESLFKLDHLATRMRRNAESLLVLAGEEPARRWSDPVPMRDVAAAASAEIEDFSRVELIAIDDAMIVGMAVNDITHLLAELIENAISFSPPHTRVEVFGRRRSTGYSLSIVDQGLGMTTDELGAANERLQNPAEFDQAPSSYLGHFVVGRLAARHGVEVELIETNGGGITGKVFLPESLFEDGLRGGNSEDPGSARRPGSLNEALDIGEPERDLERLVAEDAPAPVPPTAEELEARRQATMETLQAATKKDVADPATTGPETDDGVPLTGFSRRGGDDAPAPSAPPTPPEVEEVPLTGVTRRGEAPGTTATAEASPAPAAIPEAPARTVEPPIGDTSPDLSNTPRRRSKKGQGAAQAVEDAKRPVVKSTARSADEVREQLARFKKGVSDGKAASDTNSGEKTEES